MRVKVQRDACGGTGLCAELCPSVFAQDPDYVAYVLEGGARSDAEEGVAVAPEHVEAVREAASSCPTGAVVALEG